MKNEIKNIFINEFGISETDLNSNKTLSDMGVDSIVIIEIQFELESQFNIKIPDGDISSTFTLSDFESYIAGAVEVHA